MGVVINHKNKISDVNKLINLEIFIKKVISFQMKKKTLKKVISHTRVKIINKNKSLHISSQ